MRYQIIIFFLLGYIFIWMGLEAETSEGETSFSLDAKCYLKQEASYYIICVDIVTNLPEGSLLEVEVSYAKKVATSAVIREETGQEYEIEQIPLTKGIGNIKQNQCQIKTGFFTRRPYAGTYLVKIIFNPETQPPEVKTKLPEDTQLFSKEISFDYGTERELEEQKKQVNQEIYKVMEEIQNLFREIQEKINKYTQIDKFKTEDWQKWQILWQKKIEEVKKANQTRLSERIYWLESTAKRHIKTLCERLTEVVERYPEIVKEKGSCKNAAAEIQSELDLFQREFSSYLYHLGFDKIIDKLKVKSLIQSLLGTYHQIRELYHQVASSKDRLRWEKEITSYQRQLERDLFALIQETPDYLFAITSQIGQDVYNYFKECQASIAQGKMQDHLTQIQTTEKIILERLEKLKEALGLE